MSPQAGFLLQDQIIPRLKSAIPNAVSFIGSEDAHELIADGTLIAAQMIHNAEQSGKKVIKHPGGRRGARTVKTISAGNVAFYTIQKLKCGRRSTGSRTVDVYGSGTQINGATRLTSLDEAAPVTSVDDVGEPLVLHDVLSRDEEDPATKAARRLDWQAFMASLTARDQAIINCLVEGKPLASLARKRHLNTSTILYHKRRLPFLMPAVKHRRQRRFGSHVKRADTFSRMKTVSRRRKVVGLQPAVEGRVNVHVASRLHRVAMVEHAPAAAKPSNLLRQETTRPSRCSPTSATRRRFPP